MIIITIVVTTIFEDIERSSIFVWVDMGVAEFKSARRWKKISLAAAQKFKWVVFGFPKWDFYKSEIPARQKLFSAVKNNS